MNAFTEKDWALTYASIELKDDDEFPTLSKSLI